jgi:hypothetical protein
MDRPDASAEGMAIAAMHLRTWKALIAAEPDHRLVAFARSLLKGFDPRWFQRWVGRSRRPIQGLPGDAIEAAGLVEFVSEGSRGERWRASALGERVGVLIAPKLEVGQPTRHRRPSLRATPPVGWEWANPPASFVCQLVRKTRGKVIERASWSPVHGGELVRWSSQGRADVTPASVIQSLQHETNRKHR